MWYKDDQLIWWLLGYDVPFPTGDFEHVPMPKCHYGQDLTEEHDCKIKHMKGGEKL
jgi:hypothetical protein